MIMASKLLWGIVDFLRENQTVTPRQVQALLGCDCKKSHNLLLHLTRKSVVRRAGKPHHPAFSLIPGGELNIKRLKPARMKCVAVPARRAVPVRVASAVDNERFTCQCIAKNPVRQQVPENAIFDECRTNWQGYQIHKIFGSARV